MKPTETIQDVMDSVHSGIRAVLGDAYATLRSLDGEAVEVDVAAELLFEIDGLAKDVKELLSAANVIMDESLGNRSEYRHRLGLIERHQGSKRTKWDHDGVSSALARKIHQSATDMDTGELVLTTEEQIKELLRFAGVSYWRVGELRKFGINPAKYCKEEEGKKSISLRRNDIGY